MQVHWQHKWMQFEYAGTQIVLQGLSRVSSDKLLLQVCLVTTDSELPDLSALPDEIHLSLHQYKYLFEPATSLPPPRACNHVIPPAPDAKPIAVRPYRYPPKMKDELEKQVADMLQQGIIQPSSSSFSSPILLVPKKDGGYRFCVDYRQLNDITLKSKFHVPILDQLMDELAHA